ncbi:MAG TPA: hydroxyacylglutathione hydrolase [Chitinivibrionales bacterium]|nr:hydroxyacylglutathione hydrolase [Chitinivibrionales bacterium]
MTIPLLADNYAWILHDGTSAIVVDPGQAEPVVRFLGRAKISLTHILCSHHHTDHCAGVDELKRQYNPAVVGPDDERMPFVTDRVRDEQTRNILGQEMMVIATPGHTITHVVYYFPSIRAVFTGDTLFSAGCGRILEGTPSDMLQSLIKCAYLEDLASIYCGHEYTEENLLFATTVEPDNKDVWQRLSDVEFMARRGIPTVPSPLITERSINPFLRTGSPSLRKKLGMEKATAIEVFAELRKRKDGF